MKVLTHPPGGCFHNVSVLATVVLGFSNEAAAAAARRPPRNQRRFSKHNYSPFLALHTMTIISSMLSFRLDTCMTAGSFFSRLRSRSGCGVRALAKIEQARHQRLASIWSFHCFVLPR